MNDIWFTDEQIMDGQGYERVGSYLLRKKNCDELILDDVIGLMTPRYTCLRSPGAAGAALLSTDHKLVFGAVEPAPGMDTCWDLDECMIEDNHCVRTIHAEVRAILNAARLNVPTKGSTMYSILKPCYQCTKAIVTAGISKIVYARAAYNEDRTNAILEANNIEVISIPGLLDYGEAV